MKNIGMKNIGMKKNIIEQREGIWGESLKSLKSLKQIFGNLVKMVKMVMQIFAKGEYSAVRVSVGQHPTNIQRISNLSPTVSTVKVAQKSRITMYLPAFAMVAMLWV